MNRRSVILNGSKALTAIGIWSSMMPAHRLLSSRTFRSEDFEEIEILDIQKAYASGQLTARALTQWYLDRIKQIDKSGPTLNAIININPDAIMIAEKCDKERSQGLNKGPMHGIPVVIKDNIDSHDRMPTTAGSRALANSYPEEDSAVVDQLRKAGAIILAKANLSEWANFRASFSSSGWSGILGQTKNPYIINRNPCGSSSGSAVAVSANLCSVAIGTETNGSIVCPSHANGIVGIKPTVGLISRRGIIPISFTQDTAGPMARTVADAAVCLSVLTNKDNGDSKTLNSRRQVYDDYSAFLNKDGLKNKRIGIHLSATKFHDGVDKLFERAIKTMSEAGAEMIELEKISDTQISAEAYDVLLYEFKDGINKYLKKLGPESKIKSLEDLIKFNSDDPVELKYFNQSILEQAQAKGDLNSEEYINVLDTMLKATREYGIDKVMDEHQLDAIIAPTGSPAWTTDLFNGDRYLGGSSSPAARSGYPNITLPMGFFEALPVGISIFGKAWTENKLIEIAYAFEQLTKYRKPPQFLKE